MKWCYKITFRKTAVWEVFCVILFFIIPFHYRETSSCFVKRKNYSPKIQWKDTQTQVFSCKFYEVFQNSFFIEHLRFFLPVTYLQSYFIFCSVQTFNAIGYNWIIGNYRGRPLEVFLGKGSLKLCTKFAREYSCRIEFQ